MSVSIHWRDLSRPNGTLDGGQALKEKLGKIFDREWPMRLGRADLERLRVAAVATGQNDYDLLYGLVEKYESIELELSY